MEPSLNNLPIPVMILIFKNVSPVDIISCTKSCKSWNQAISNNRLWNQLYIFFFKNAPNNIENWKEFFGKRYKANTNMLNNECTVSRLRYHDLGILALYVDQKRIISFGKDKFLCEIELETGKLLSKSLIENERMKGYRGFDCFGIKVHKDYLIIMFSDAFLVTKKDGEKYKLVADLSDHAYIYRFIAIHEDKLVYHSCIANEEGYINISEIETPRTNPRTHRVKIKFPKQEIRSDCWMYKSKIYIPLADYENKAHEYHTFTLFKDDVVYDGSIKLEDPSLYGIVRGFKKYIYYFNSKKELVKINIHKKRFLRMSIPLTEFSESLESFDFDSYILSVGGSYGSIFFYDFSNKNQGKIGLGSHSGKVNNIQLVGPILVSGGDDGNILVWNFMKPEKLLPCHYYFQSEIDYFQKKGIKIDVEFSNSMHKPVPVLPDPYEQFRKQKKCVIN